MYSESDRGAVRIDAVPAAVQVILQLVRQIHLLERDIPEPIPALLLRAGVHGIFALPQTRSVATWIPVGMNPATHGFDFWNVARVVHGQRYPLLVLCRAHKHVVKVRGSLKH